MTNTINTLNPTFTTREEYLAFRGAWRAEYKALSLEIRQMKRTVKEEQRAGTGTSQWLLVRKRKQANALMKARTKATELMRMQRAAALEARAA